MPKEKLDQNGVLHVFPDDATEEEMAASMAAFSPAPTTTGRQGGPGRPAPGGGPGTATESALKPSPAQPSMVDTAVDLLPTAGGLAGGLIGGAGGTAFGFGYGGIPGATYGATLGGATGEAWRQFINDARGKPGGPDTRGDAAGRIGWEGIKQGTGELAGRGFGAGLQLFGRGAVGQGLAPIESVANRYGRANLSQRYLDEYRPFNRAFNRGGVGPLGEEESMQQSLRLGTASKAEHEAMLQAADAAPNAVTTASPQIANSIQPMIREAFEAWKTGDATDMRPVIRNRIMAFVQRQNPRMTNVELNEARKVLDDRIGKAMEAGPLAPDASLQTEMDKKLAQAMREALRDNVPGSEEVARRTFELGGLTKALRKDANRNQLLTKALAINTVGGIGAGLAGYQSDLDPTKGLGTGLTTAALLYGAQNPAMLGRIGYASNRLGQAARYAPTATRLNTMRNAFGQMSDSDQQPPATRDLINSLLSNLGPERPLR